MNLIQFHCPACGVLLRLPLSMAGSKGPCPRCSKMLLAPEPSMGLGPRLAPPAKSEVPFAEIGEPPASADPSPVSRGNSAPNPGPSDVPEVTKSGPVCQGRPHVAIFVLSLLLTAVVSMIAGFLLGNRISVSTNVPPLPAHLPSPPPAVQQVEAPPKVVLVKPPTDPPRIETQPAGQNIQTAVAAETALKAFLDAPDWMTRSAYVLSPKRVRSAMESYSHKVPDGPTVYTEIKRQDAFLDQKTGSSYFVFYVITEKHPHGIPTVVAETKSGWLIDWEAFVEFRDEQFKTFADGPRGQSGKFHLLVSVPPPPRAANTENEFFASFLIGPPGSESARIAYVKKGSETYMNLSAALQGNEVFAPVLEVAKRSTPDGKTYLEIASIVATRWLPAAEE